MRTHFDDGRTSRRDEPARAQSHETGDVEKSHDPAPLPLRPSADARPKPRPGVRGSRPPPPGRLLDVAGRTHWTRWALTVVSHETPTRLSLSSCSVCIALRPAMAFETLSQPTNCAKVCPESHKPGGGRINNTARSDPSQAHLDDANSADPLRSQRSVPHTESQDAFHRPGSGLPRSTPAAR